MSSKRGAEYLKKIGLENGHNAVKTIASPFFEVSGDEEIINIALRNSAVYTKQYGKKYRLMTFILKRDDSGYILFNDNGGYNVAGPTTISLLLDTGSKTLLSPLDAIFLVCKNPSN